jgi:hypothetical protein
MLEDILPDRFYSTGQAAYHIPSTKRDGYGQHPSTMTKAITKGYLFPDGIRRYLRARRTPGGFLILGRDLIEFLNSYNDAYGVAFDPDPSDSSNADPSAVTAPTANAKARAEAAAKDTARRLKAASEASKARARRARAAAK